MFAVIRGEEVVSEQRFLFTVSRGEEVVFYGVSIE